MRCCSLSLSATGEAARPASQQRLRVAFVVASGLRVQLRSPRIGLCGRILALDNLGETRFVVILGFRETPLSLQAPLAPNSWLSASKNGPGQARQVATRLYRARGADVDRPDSDYTAASPGTKNTPVKWE